MNGFEYQYHTPNNIFDNVLLITEASPVEYGVFSVMAIVFLFFLFFIIPSINIIIVYLVKTHESKKRKNFIKQIAIQKDIEDQIADEIDVH